MFVNQVIAHTYSHHLLLYVGSSPLLVDPEENGMPLTIVAVDSSCSVAVTRGTIEIPTVPPPTTAPGSLIVTAWATYNTVVVDIVSWVDMWGGISCNCSLYVPVPKLAIGTIFVSLEEAHQLQCCSFWHDVLVFSLAWTKVLSPFHPGPVMITVSTDLPDLFGRLRIRFNTSRPDVKCACIINSFNITACMYNSFYSVQGLF